MNLNRKLQRLPFLPRTNPHLAPPSAGSGGAHEASLANARAVGRAAACIAAIAVARAGI